jgi:hypothetical protein
MLEAVQCLQYARHMRRFCTCLSAVFMQLVITLTKFHNFLLLVAKAEIEQESNVLVQ